MPLGLRLTRTPTWSGGDAKYMHRNLEWRKCEVYAPQLGAAEMRCICAATWSGGDASSSRRCEYPDGSLLIVNERGARSNNVEMRSICAVNLG